MVELSELSESGANSWNKMDFLSFTDRGLDIRSKQLPNTLPPCYFHYIKAGFIAEVLIGDGKLFVHVSQRI